MSVYIEYHIDKKLEELPFVLRQEDPFWERLLDRVGREGVKIMKEEAPVRTGRLQESIHYEPDVNKREVHVKCEAEYAAAVERGTKAHDIIISKPLSLRDKAMREGKKNLYFRAGTVFHHPGSKPNPFGKRTRDRLAEKVNDITSEEVENWLAEIA